MTWVCERTNHPKYFVVLKFHSGKVERMEFDSMTERALAIIGYSAWADVLEQGQCAG